MVPPYILKNLKKSNADHVHSETLLKSQLKEASEQISELQSQIAALRKVQTAKSKVVNNAILNDLVTNEAEEDDNKNFNEETFELAVQIRDLSPKAYTLLSTKMPFPKPSLIDKIYNETVSKIPELLLDSDNVTTLVDMWKEKNIILKSPS